MCNKADADLAIGFDKSFRRCPNADSRANREGTRGASRGCARILAFRVRQDREEVVTPDWLDRIPYPRLEEDRGYAECARLDDETCPACGGTDVCRYPANHQAPRITVTCQDCLHVVHVVRLEQPKSEDIWPPYRAVVYDWKPSLAERASRIIHDRPDTDKGRKT